MLRRLRKGEWLVVGGLVGLAASLFLNWFTASVDLECGALTTSGGTAGRICPLVSETLVGGGWGGLGRPWADVLVLSVIAVVFSLVLTLRSGPGRPTYGAVVGLVIAGSVTALATLLTAIRVLLARPSGGAWEHQGASAEISIGIGPGGWVGLASLLVLWIGLWVAIADDRPDAPDSAFDLPAPRPVPAPKPPIDAEA